MTETVQALESVVGGSSNGWKSYSAYKDSGLPWLGSIVVAIELKVGRFKPEHLGKLNFYLEALNRDVRKPHKNPSVGLLLCATKDKEAVEYAIDRVLSLTLIRGLGVASFCCLWYTCRLSR